MTPMTVQAMNHCVLEVEVIDAPTVRYTQDNQTPIAEMHRFGPASGGRSAR